MSLPMSARTLSVLGHCWHVQQQCEVNLSELPAAACLDWAYGSHVHDVFCIVTGQSPNTLAAAWQHYANRDNAFLLPPLAFGTSCSH